VFYHFIHAIILISTCQGSHHSTSEFCYGAALTLFNAETAETEQTKLKNPVD